MTSLADVFKRADAYDARDLLEGDHLARIREKIARNSDKRSIPVLNGLLDGVLKSKLKGHWNCDDTSTVEMLAGVNATTIADYLTAYCTVYLPNAQITTTTGSNRRIRFHPQGSFGMSITSWHEIALVRFESPSPSADSNLTDDDELGYPDTIRRFRSAQEVCEEMSRVEALLVERRQQVAESKRLASVCKQVDAWLKSSSSPRGAKTWFLNDQGLHIELTAGVHAVVSLAEEPSFRRRSWSDEDKEKKAEEHHAIFSCDRCNQAFSFQRDFVHHREQDCRQDSSLCVLFTNPFDERYSWSVNKVSATQVFKHIESWDSAHKRRAVAHETVFLPAIRKWVLRTPAHKPDEYADIRLLFVGGDVWNPLLLWAAVKMVENRLVVMVCPHLYEDDSGCLPQKSSAVACIPLDEKNLSSLKGTLNESLTKLHENFLQVKKLFTSILIERLSDGRWRKYKLSESKCPGGKLSEEKKDDDKEEKKQKSDVVDIIVHGGLGFEFKMYLCEPFSVDLCGTYNDQGWGLRIQNFWEVKLDKLIKSENELDQQLEQLKKLKAAAKA